MKPCQLKWSNLASEAPPRQSAGAQAPDLSQAPRQSGAPAPSQAGQARARKFLELSQGQCSFLSHTVTHYADTIRKLHGNLEPSPAFTGAMEFPEPLWGSRRVSRGLAEADAVTCTIHWRPQWRRAGRGVDEEKKEKEEEELHPC